jgi:outer membrane receptor protein involved in Fe transport
MALLLILPALSAFAQFENGSLVGTIHDSSGAVVPNVSVAVTNNATGIVTNVTSNASGDYEVPSLRFGIYTVSAKAAGFAEAEAKQITIPVGGRVRIDLVLSVGTAQATVEVSDVALQLETESSQRDQTITEYQTEALPLVTRNYSDLVDYVTGAHGAPADATTTAVTSLTRAGSFNVNGQRSMFNDYLLDGMDNNSYGESNQGFDNQIIEPPPDSIAQFEVVTNNESAEYGRSSGATVNVATKSGSNQFHTTLYEFLRNTDLNAFGFIKPIATNAVTGAVIPPVKPAFNRNQFGVDFGGPFLKNRFFYFLDYEGFRQTLTPTVIDTVPTTNELSGILAVAVQDPWHPGTYIPAGTNLFTSAAAGDIDPTAKVIAGLYLNALPAQCTVTAGLSSTGVATNNCPVNAPFTDHADKGDLRLDFQQNQQTSWFLKVSDRKEVGKNYPLLPEPIDMQTNGETLIHDEQLALGYTHLMGDNKVLDARLAFSGTKGGKWTFAVGNTSFPENDIPGLPTVAGVSGGLPSIAITGGFSGFGRQSTNPQWQNPSMIDPKLNFSWVKGRHSLKFGFEYEHLWEEVEDSNPLYGSFNFNNGYSKCPASAGTLCPNTSAVGDTFWADFLFGASGGYALSTYWIAHILQTMDSTYAQDDWQVSSKLTLNLGLRWEYGSPYSEQNDNLSNFNPETGTMLTLTPNFANNAANLNAEGFPNVEPGMITPYTGGGRVYGKTLVNAALGDWGPRLGFAYAPTSTIAVRGGFGTAFVHYWRAGSGNMLAINAPNAMYTSVVNPTPVPGVGLGATTGYQRLSAGFPTGLATTFSAGTDDIDYIPKNTKDGYAESYYLDVEKTLAKNILVDVAYVGNHGLHLQGLINANQKNPALGFIGGNPANGWPRPYPNWGGSLLNNPANPFNIGDITDALNEFHSSYNSLQARYQQRFVGGLTMLNSFTWSHALDNASSTLEANTPDPQNAYNLEADYGQSDYNLPITNVTSLVYDLPIGHGKRFLSDSNGVMNAVIGGWQISAVNTMQAGTPFNLTYTPAQANQVSPMLSQNWRGENLYRPNLVPGVPYIKKTLLANGDVEYVNPEALTLPSTYVGNASINGVSSPFGSLPKNYGRTPAYYETDLDLNKTFDTPLSGMKVQLRSEFYNVFNHTNLYMPGGAGGGTVAGAYNNSSAPTSLGGGIITGTWEPRIIQFALKVIY